MAEKDFNGADLEILLQTLTECRETLDRKINDLKVYQKKSRSVEEADMFLEEIKPPLKKQKIMEEIMEGIEEDCKKLWEKLQMVRSGEGTKMDSVQGWLHEPMNEMSGCYCNLDGSKNEQEVNSYSRKGRKGSEGYGEKREREVGRINAVVGVSPIADGLLAQGMRKVLGSRVEGEAEGEYMPDFSGYCEDKEWKTADSDVKEKFPYWKMNCSYQNDIKPETSLTPGCMSINEPDMKKLLGGRASEDKGATGGAENHENIMEKQRLVLRACSTIS